MSGITYAGIDLGGTNYGLSVVSDTREVLPEPRVHVYDLAARDGHVSQGATYRGRRVVVRCILSAASRANAAIQLSNVMGVLMLGQLGEQSLVFNDRPDRRYWARVGRSIESRDLRVGEDFELLFVCSNAFPESVEETETGTHQLGGETEFEESISGNGAVYPDYIIENSDIIDAGFVQIVHSRPNFSSNVIVRVDPIPAGCFLKLESRTGKFYTSTDGIAWLANQGDVHGSLGAAVPGSNVYCVSGVSSGNFSMRYRATYLV